MTRLLRPFLLVLALAAGCDSPAPPPAPSPGKLPPEVEHDPVTATKQYQKNRPPRR